MSEFAAQRKPLSPAILEQQVEELRVRLENEKLDHEKTKAERDIYRNRIFGFERMTASLAAKVDQICRDFENLIGPLKRDRELVEKLESVEEAVEFVPIGDLIPFDIAEKGIVLEERCRICGRQGTPEEHGGNCEEKDQVARDFNEGRA